MAPNNLESPSKKRKQPANTAHLKRDQPLFASRRSAPTLQQPPDFLTDSLNTSYIPSPSPEKSPTRQDLRAKPRQALDRKSLAAAFKATASPNDENKPPSSSLRRSATQSRKPRPTQAAGHATAQSADERSQNPARLRTPTPPRGRQVSDITSPSNSESSPGRGYAEAYQRIVEEENLAQEGSTDDLGMDGLDYSYNDPLNDPGQMRLHRKCDSASPRSLRASRRASPQSHVHAKPEEINAENKETIADDTGSEVGNLYHEDVTNSSLDSASSQYARDLQRLSGALKSRPKAFSKARLGERVGLTVENLSRRNGSNESLRSTQSVGSFSHRGSDSSLNVPKAWGRKARPGNDWLSRINSRSGRLTGDVPKRQSSGEQMVADNEKRDRGENIDEWIAAAAEVPLPGGQNGSSLVTSSSKSTPIAGAHKTTTRDPRRDWEMDDDFTGQSMQISESPPIRIRNDTLDRLRNHEMETLEKQAVTTNRLGEIRDKTSLEHIQNRSPRNSSPEHHPDRNENNLGSAQRRRSSGQSNSQLKPRSSKAHGLEIKPEVDLEDIGDPIPDTPVVIYKKNSNNLIGFDEDSAKQIQASRRAARRPSHGRKDSHDLLKRLARAASDSPSPDKGQIGAERFSSEINRNVEQTPQVSKAAADKKTPVVTGAWIDRTMGETPQASPPNTNLKTPFITGAWVDTPLPTGGRGPPMPTPSGTEDHKELNNGRLGANELIKKLNPNADLTRPQLRPQEPLKYTGPPLPKSALENIINNAKDSKGKGPLIQASSDSEDEPTLHLGESTIQSLEDMIANDTDFSTILAPTPPSQETSPPTSDPSPDSMPASTTEQKTSRLGDTQSYTKILSRLTSLAPSLRDSKKQIASLERAVIKNPANVALANGGGCDEAGEFHDFIWPCQKCGCPGKMEPDFDGLLTLRDNIMSIRIPIPRLWRWRQGQWRPQLTWLGLLTLVGWIMVAAEAWARSRYCHPLYARSMIGYGVDINAPRPPFVLFKVIHRSTAFGSILAPVYYLLRLILKLFASFIGYIVGFMFGDNEKIRQPVGTDQRTPRPNLSMMDDEYL